MPLEFHETSSSVSLLVAVLGLGSIATMPVTSVTIPWVGN
jgi:hypothetical protein